MMPANREDDFEPVPVPAPFAREAGPALVATTELPPAAEPASERAVVRAQGLSKQYRSPWTLRTVDALKSVSFEIHPGEVVGLLGPNGAGKTTTLKLLTGLLKPTRGDATMFGLPITDVASRRRLGFLPEQPYFYDYLNGFEYLEFAGRLSGLGSRDAVIGAREWLGRVGLGDRPRLVLRKYSKGMLQRLGLAAALVHGPDLLILDEPMSGLDPFGRRDVRELILEQREKGTTILFSSHILPDVEMLCDRVLIIMNGELVRSATLADLMEHGAHGVEIRCVGTPLLEIPAAWRSVLSRSEHADGTAFMLTDSAQLDAVVAWLMKNGVGMRAVTPQRSSLEDLFLSAARTDESRADHAVSSS